MNKLILLLFTILCYSLSAQNQAEIIGESWEISNGTLQLGKKQSDSLAIKYWNYLNNLLPSKLLKRYVTRLILFTDGAEEVLGEIAPLNNINTKWSVAIDTIDFKFEIKDSTYIQDYTHTLIHEFGHLLTLNPEQVEITDDDYQDDEKGYLTSEGYAKKNSYLGEFVSTFWNADFLKEWDKIDNIKNENRKVRRLQRFYFHNKNQFLSDYASESPEEDIAESWTFFVLSDKPSKFGKIKLKKILFFYKFPELIQLRSEIRSKISLIPIDYVNNYK
ncbi:putative zinc-binding metallopeptidase [Aquimarina spongiae]|uniref:Putative zinc-binding metallo-peptidase n=1 Tax=Aquimarina spongiae TaxID=570521 RepID=A0A1M6JPR9_9FLAO|nr:putative zinc-binding metallopeptidase [Aquimarina spongiae]SHJ48662.1 Putative zinc-binding metallo-peptidase [Aquimarina spongiae]